MSDISGGASGRSHKELEVTVLGRGRMVTGVKLIGDFGNVGEVHDSLRIWRLKLRKLLDDDLEKELGDIGPRMVLRLFERPAEDGGVTGVPGTVMRRLLLRMLLPVDDEVEELLVLELILRNLPKADRLL